MKGNSSIISGGVHDPATVSAVDYYMLIVMVVHIK